MPRYLLFTILVTYSALALQGCSDNQPVATEQMEDASFESGKPVFKTTKAVPEIQQTEGIPTAPISGFCADETSSCVSDRADFANNQWPKAYSGDYQAQRNVAFCLSDGCYGAVQVNKLAACAWRRVILASGHDGVEDGDVRNMKLDCGTLDPLTQEVSSVRAKKLIEEIERRKS
jgi:hypothetical protein